MLNQLLSLWDHRQLPNDYQALHETFLRLQKSYYLTQQNTVWINGRGCFFFRDNSLFYHTQTCVTAILLPYNKQEPSWLLCKGVLQHPQLQEYNPWLTNLLAHLFTWEQDSYGHWKLTPHV